jgi:hypothetical protein
MLPHYSRSVAETFSMLTGSDGEGRPGRRPRAGERSVDGVRAPARSGARPRQTTSRTFCRAAGHVHDRMPVTHRFARLAKLPGGPIRLTSGCSGRLPRAAVGGRPRPALRVCGLHQPRRCRIAPAIGRLHAVSDASGAARRGGHLTLCADTDEIAHRLAASSRMAFTLFLQGRLIPVRPSTRHSSSSRSIRRRSALVNGADGSSDRLRPSCRESNRWLRVRR